jgi:SIR2-like domain
MNNPETFPLVLLGAGASVPAGVPTALGMTAKMMEICKNERKQDFVRTLRGITGALEMGYGQTANEASEGEAAFAGPDIERVLNAASLLGDRFGLEFAPFVAAWHPIIEDLERRILTSSEARRIVNQAAGISLPQPRQRFDTRNAQVGVGAPYIKALVERAFEGLVEHLSQRPDGALFRDLVHFLTRKLITLTWLQDPNKLDYLDPLLNAARDRPITVITLNYDNGIELRAARLEIKCETSIKAWSEGGAFPTASAVGVDLVKLHGSVTWWWGVRNEEAALGLKYRALSEHDNTWIKQISSNLSDEPGRAPEMGVIFGGRNKLTADGPFLELLTKFREALNRHSHLFVVGYSFRDPHVNQSIARWLHRSAGASRVTVVDKPNGVETDHPFCRRYRKVLGERLAFDPIGAEAGIAKQFSRSA